jgi:hypothetical protein
MKDTDPKFSEHMQACKMLSILTLTSRNIGVPGN